MHRAEEGTCRSRRSGNRAGEGVNREFGRSRQKPRLGQLTWRGKSSRWVGDERLSDHRLGKGRRYRNRKQISSQHWGKKHRARSLQSEKPVLLQWGEDRIKCPRKKKGGQQSATSRRGDIARGPVVRLGEGWRGGKWKKKTRQAVVFSSKVLP